MSTPKKHQPSWRTLVLAISSVSFAFATVLDLAGVVGALRATSVILSVLGFVALGASTVAVWLTSYRRQRHHRTTAATTLLVPDDTSAEDAPAPVDDVPEVGAARREERRAGLSAAVPAQMTSNAVQLTDRDTIAALDRIAAENSSMRLRLAGKRDLTAVSEAGKDAIGSDFFYDPEELEAYVLQQRDAVWCLERSVKGNPVLVGYAILLALKPTTVERIKSGDIAFGRHILASDIEDSIDDTDAIYISMVHGFDDGAKLDIGLAALRRVMQSHTKRRPQLILAREGTPEGGLGMKRLGFERFGLAPFIEATYTDSPTFAREVSRREGLHKRYLWRQASASAQSTPSSPEPPASV